MALHLILLPPIPGVLHHSCSGTEAVFIYELRDKLRLLEEQQKENDVKKE